MSFAFDEAVAVGHFEHLNEGGRPVRRYHVQIQEKFSAGGAPFGGIIFASVINALTKDFSDPKNDSTVDKKKTGKARWPHPLSAQTTFLSISKTGAAYVDVRRLKEGGRSAVAEAVLRQDQQTKSGGYESVDILCVVATFGDLAAEEGPDYVTEQRPPIEFSQGQLDWRPMPGAGVQDMVERTTKLPPLRPGVLTPSPVVYHASRFRDLRPTDVVALAFWSDMFNSPVRRIPELQEKGFRGMTMVGLTRSSLVSIVH
jgi:hypothetical protein